VTSKEVVTASANDNSDGCLSDISKNRDAPPNYINCIFSAPNIALIGTRISMASSLSMRTDQPKTELHHDHVPDTDDMWAWIIIGFVAAGVILAIWSPTLKALLQT